MDVTVVMRSKNSEWVIDQALAALYSQKGVQFELHLVDSGSTDSTLGIAKRYPCRIDEIEASSYFPGKVLNDALEKVTTDTVVFVNSDCVLLTPDSLSPRFSRNSRIQKSWQRMADNCHARTPTRGSSVTMPPRFPSLPAARPLLPFHSSFLRYGEKRGSESPSTLQLGGRRMWRGRKNRARKSPTRLMRSVCIRTTTI